MRQLSPWRALCAGLLGFGYLYVGRIALAIFLVVVLLGLFAAIAWTRMIMHAEFVYIFIIATAIGFALQLFHPVVIAVRSKQASRKPYNRWWIYIFWILGSALVSQLLLSVRGAMFGYETYRIPSTSMSPTLESGDWIIVDAWRYRSSSPAHGEVIVYEHNSVNYVKRIVGLPGDRIEIRDGTLYRNGESVVEPYLHAQLQSGAYRRNVGSTTLNASQYYVLGDFRDNSLDSRRMGPIAPGQIVGRVEFIWFSLGENGVRWEKIPEYFRYGE